MVEFCARVALYQIEHGRYFIIENPATSKIWFTKCFQRLLMKHAVTYGTLDMCAFGMRDPNGYYYYKPTSLLYNFPVFKRCSNTSKKDPTHYHQPLEGSAPGYGSRTKLAQVYPYRFCSTLIRSILPLGNPRALYPTQLPLAVDLLGDLNLDELRGVQNQLAALTASEHPVLATDLYKQGLHFQYAITIRDAYSTALMLCPLVMFITLFRSKHNKMFHTSDRCISVRPCLTTQSFFLVVFSPDALLPPHKWRTLTLEEEGYVTCFFATSSQRSITTYC